MTKIKLTPFLRDVVTTAIASIAVIISMIIVTRILAKGLGPEAFGAYSLARRIVANIIPFSSLSLGVSLTRYIAISRNEKQKDAYLVASVTIVSVISLFILFIGHLGSKNFAVIIFHDLKYLMLFYATLFMTMGLGFNTIVYSYYRGVQRMDMANLWRVCIIAIFPLIVSYAFVEEHNVALILFLMGLSAYLTIFPITLFLKRVEGIKLSQVKSAIRDLLKYGVPRAPGGIFLGFMLTIGPFLAPTFGTMRDAGYLVVGQSVYRIIGSSVVAFGLVALPKISQIFSQGKDDFLRKKIEDILAMIIHVGLFGMIQMFIWSNEIVSIWLGDEYLEAVPIIRIFLLSLCPYLGYVMLRSIIDAVEVRAINTLNLFISLGVTILFCLTFGKTVLGILGLAVGVTMGVVCLGISTTFFLVRRFKITFENMKLSLIAVANCICAGIGIFAQRCLSLYFGNVALLVAIFILELTLFSMYLWLLYGRDTRWVMELKRRIFFSGIQKKETGV